jgi:uncharacterized cupredoxin-like copper-binding protein
MRRAWATLAVLSALGLGLGACGDDDDGGDASGSDTLALTVTEATDSYTFEGVPETVEGGTVTISLDNTGAEVHEFQLLKVDDGTTFADIQPLLEEEGAPIPDAVQDGGGGVGSVAPGATGSTTQELSEGTWVYFCTFSADAEDAPPHYELGMAGEMTVEGDGADADAPDIAGTVTAREYELQGEDLEAGDISVKFENEGEQFHHFFAVPMAEGATFEEAQAAILSDEEPTGPPPVDFEKGVSSAVIAPGQDITTTVTLEAGNYVFMCFISDREGGEPHALKGMINQVTVG